MPHLEGDELASRLVTWFEGAETDSEDARTLAERDRDYYDNKQWTSEEVQVLNDRKQPVITINRIKRKVDALKGIERQQRTDPKAFPRNPSDEDASEAATDAIRYVIDNNNYDQIRSNYWENLIIEGIGAVKISVTPGKRGMEISIKRVAWDRFFYDPHSNEHDFSDAKFIGEVIWMDRKDAERKWPGKKDIISATMVSDSLTETYDDKPKFRIWSDNKRDRVRIIQTRWKDGDEWRITTSTKGGILKDDVSPFLDEDGKPESDLLAVSAFIDRDNARYGTVREMISPQDEINKRRSKALHLMSVRQIRVDPATEAAKDIEEVRAEAAKPDGVIKARRDDLEILPNGDMAQAQFSLLQEAKNEIDAMGVNASLQGKQGTQLSGRALLAQQQAGLVELAPMLDRKRDMDIRVYRTIWNRVKQFWNEERWIRVTDDEDKPRFVGLNKPMTVRDQLEKEFGEIPEQFQNLQELDQPAQEDGKPIIENSVGEMDVDIILDEGPDSITLQSEQFEQLVQMAQVVPIPPDIIIEASSLRNKKRLLEKLQGGGEDVDPEQAAQEQALQQQALELQLRGAEADVAKTEAEAIDKQASAVERGSKTQLNLVQADNVQ